MTLPFKAQEQTKFWQAGDIGDLDLLRATYITHTFSRHTHQGYAIGVIERGAETFYYRGQIHIAPAGTVVVINPDEVHTGQAVDESGWTYRMLYPEISLVQQAAAQVPSLTEAIPNFPNPVIQDPYLADRIRNLHIVLETSESQLERESYFISTLAELIIRHADSGLRSASFKVVHNPVRQARDYMKAYYADRISLNRLAAVANLSPYHFIRIFQAAVGLPPHAYLNQIRIERAKELLSQGGSIAQIAAATGFSDQSHLSKRFKRIVGVTPGQYRNNVQDRLA